MTQSLSPRPADLSLAVWLAPFATGRRVLWIGDPASGGPEQLAAHADSVRVLDTSGRGHRRRGNAVRVSSFRPGAIDLPAGSFDLAVITDVAVLDELGLRLRELARAVGDEGIVVAGTSADDGHYDALRDALGDACAVVRVVGQASFRGVALADLSRDAADSVIVDGSLVAESGIERVYAIGADELPTLEPYLVVQLPSELPAAVLTTAVELDAPREEKTAILEEALVGRSREAEALREALERAESRLEQLQGRLVGTESELAEARAALRELGKVESDQTGEVAAIEERLRERGQRVRELEAELAHHTVVVRDLVEELREHQLGRRGAVGGARWLDAEAARTEAELASDELRVALLAREEELAVVRAQEAALEGEARGLRARAAELAELHETASARVRLLELAQEDGAKAHRALEARVGELTEQLELAWIQARGASEVTVITTRDETSPQTSPAMQAADARVAELEASERHLSARVGELSGQLVAARDLVERLEEERDRARGETLRLSAQLSAFETRVEGLRRGYEHRIALLASETPQVTQDTASTPPRVTGTDEAIERELARVREELASLRGEREGLRLRLRDREAALLAAMRTKPAVSPQLAPEELDRLRDEVASLRAENGALELRSVDLASTREVAEQRAADLAQKLAGRDALLTRLQMDLAEEEQTARLLDDKLARARAEVARLREGLVDASTAVDAKERAEKKLAEAMIALRDAERRAIEADVVHERLVRLEAESTETHARTEGELVTLRTRAEHAEHALAAARRDAEAEVARLRAEHEAATAELRQRADETISRARRDSEARVAKRDGAISDVRVGLTDLRRLLDGWRVEEGAARRRAEITEVGLEAPGDEDSRLVRLERDLDDKDTLLRSLTAQLEERDDRLRALERRLAEGGASGDGEDVRRELLELQERVARLHDELDHERQARGLAEDTVEQLRRRPAADEELARLERSLREREAALREAVSKAGSYERDVESLRGVCAQARQGLEVLLGAATDRGDPRTAERIGELLGVLGRFA